MSLFGCKAASRVCGLSLQPIGCTSALSVTYSAAAAAVAAYSAICVISFERRCHVGHLWPRNAYYVAVSEFVLSF